MGGSMFQSAPFSAGLGRIAQKPSLGQTEQTWYTRAKAAVGEYDVLWARAQNIADKQYRDGLATKFHGNAADQNGALYRRDSVAFNVSEAEGSTPIKYTIFVEPRVQGRVEKLEEWNRAFTEDVTKGEGLYGTQAPIEDVKKTVTQEDGMPAWVLPVVGLTALVVAGSFLFGSSE